MINRFSLNHLTKTFSRILLFSVLVALCACKGKEDPASLSVSPSSLNFNADGGSGSINITCNKTWQASVQGSGFSLSKSSGEGNGSISVTAAANTGTDERSASVSITTEGLSQTVKLQQSAKSTMTVSGGDKNFGAEGGTVDITVQSNVQVSYQIASSASWITFTGSKAMATTVYSFRIAANTTYDKRSGTITFKDAAGSITPYVCTISQDAMSAVIAPQSVEVSHTENTFDVDVQHSADITYKIVDTWIKASSTKGLNTDRYSFIASANMSKAAREGSIIFSTEDKAASDTLIVKQGAKNFSSSAKTAKFDYNGGKWEVVVESNTGVDCAIDASWINLGSDNQTAMSGDMVRHTLSFDITANDTYSQRSGKVTIKDPSGVYEAIDYDIEQTQEYVISVSPEDVEAPYSGLEFTATVKFSTPYDITCSQPWVKVAQTKALESESVDFTIDATYSSSARTAFIAFATILGSAKDTIFINQAAGDRQTTALIDFYNALDGKNWTSGKNKNWLSDLPIDQWAGVIVTDGNVTTLDLENAGLKGNLPDALYDLQGLEKLNLSNNSNLKGNLSAKLSQCYYLQELYLNNTGLGGTIPQEWKSNSALRILDLSGCALQGPLPEDVFPAWTHISKINLSNNTSISTALPTSIASIRTDSKDLSILLDNCNFSGSIPSLWAEIQDMKGISELKVNNNRLSGSVPRSLQLHPDWEQWKASTNILPQRSGKLTLEVLAPTMGETVVSAIKATTASVTSSMIDDGGANPSSYAFICGDKSFPATVSNGIISANLSKLSPNTTYKVKVSATNTAGVGYGPEAEFLTATVPTLSVPQLSDITGVSVACQSSIKDYGRDEDITEYGFIVNNRKYKASNLENGSFGATVSNLNNATKYHVSAYATNSAGTGVSEEAFFTTATIPSLNQLNVTNVTATGAVVSGSISGTGGSPITEKGIMVNGIKQAVTTEGNDILVTLTDLYPATAYEVLAYATNIVGTAYGIPVSFTTKEAGSLIGNVKMLDGTNLSGASVTMELIPDSWAVIPPATSSTASVEMANEVSMRPYTAEDFAKNWKLVRRSLLEAKARFDRGIRPSPVVNTKSSDSNPQATYSATTDNNGGFTINNMDPGYYGIKISKNGYVTYHSQIKIAAGYQSMNISSFRSLNGATAVQWYKDNTAIRAFSSTRVPDTLSITTTWAPADIQSHIGKKLQEIVFYPSQKTNFTLLLFNSASLADEMLKAMQNTDLTNTTALIGFAMKYGKYMMMLQDVSPGCTNVINYSSNALFPDTEGIAIKSNEGFMIMITTSQSTASGVMMTDGNGPAVSEKGNLVILSSNTTKTNLKQFGYEGNWHIGFTLK